MLLAPPWITRSQSRSAAQSRRRVLDAYERRLDLLVTHPRFGYAISYRRIFEVQVRLLARFLMGETAAYPAFCTR